MAYITSWNYDSIMSGMQRGSRERQMKYKKVRIRREGKLFYPQYKRIWQWWYFILGTGLHYPVCFKTFEEAKEFLIKECGK